MSVPTFMFYKNGTMISKVRRLSLLYYQIIHKSTLRNVSSSCNAVSIGAISEICCMYTTDCVAFHQCFDAASDAKLCFDG
jgi:hypothetical protein